MDFGYCCCKRCRCLKLDMDGEKCELYNNYHNYYSKLLQYLFDGISI